MSNIERETKLWLRKEARELMEELKLMRRLPEIEEDQPIVYRALEILEQLADVHEDRAVNSAYDQGYRDGQLAERRRMESLQ